MRRGRGTRFALSAAAGSGRSSGIWSLVVKSGIVIIRSSYHVLPTSSIAVGVGDHVGRRLVEDEDARISQQRAGRSVWRVM